MDMKKTFIIVQNNEIQITDTSFVTVESNTITIEDNGAVYITYQLENKEKSITIINNAKETTIFEKYRFIGKSTLHKTIKANDYSSIARYVDNETGSLDNEENMAQCHVYETVEANEGVKITCAYVDMADAKNENKIIYKLIGQDANVNVRLAALSKTNESKHIEITMEHLAPMTYANMDNYGVVKQNGSLVIDGVCTIKKGMYQSQSHQVNKIIVFDSASSAKANPYLYIDEYDVKASHGASVGKIDEEHLYYLQSRGLTRNEAMHLVVYGYFTPVLEYVHDDELKAEFSNKIKEKVQM